MHHEHNSGEESHKRGLYGAVRRSVYRYGFLRWILSVPVIFIYSVSFALLSPEYRTQPQIAYDDLLKRIAGEKKEVTTPVTLPSDFFYYSSAWQDMAGENPLVNTIITSSVETLFKSMNFLKDIQDNDDAAIKSMISEKLGRLENRKAGSRTAGEIYESISNKGEFFSRLFEQLFTQHGMKKLGAKYSDTDVEVFFNMLVRNPEEKQFRRLLGALALNAPYYLVIKNSINEYYQNSDVLFPVDLYTFTLFMMYLELVKKMDSKPAIADCRNWVFSVIVPDEGKRKELQSAKFSVQQINREEMIMPNPGYFSKAYNRKKHKAIDIASERGTMIRSPVTGTVTYYEKSPKKYITGNFIVIKDERSHFNIFICHMDSKDYIEGHSTEGELAEPIANLTPDWIHPLKKGQFFQVVGNTGKSTGAHTHIQIAQRTSPYPTFDFFAVNKPYQKQFNEYLLKNSYWHVYSRNEQLLLPVLGMAASRYDSTRHFADRDPAVLASYSQLQKIYTPVSVTIDALDLLLEEIPENILRTCFSKTIQEKIINERYEDQLRYYAALIIHFNFFLNMTVTRASAPPAKCVPVTPWQLFRRRGKSGDDSEGSEEMHEFMFYNALNKYFLYKIMQLNDTPREERDQMLNDPMFTGITEHEVPDALQPYPSPSFEDRISLLQKYIQGITAQPVDVTFIFDDDFCASIFADIKGACRVQGFAPDLNFGFFRYHMTELQHSYQTSRFVHFPDTREFSYDKKFDHAIRSFFLDLLELAAEHSNRELFTEMYRPHGDEKISLIMRIIRRSGKRLIRTFYLMRFKLFGTVYPAEPNIYPYHLHSVFQKLVRNIVSPASYESRTYAEKTYYRAAETAIFYSLIYEVYLAGREHYMKLFPLDQLTSVIDAIGLFDSMLKVFCDNTAQKQLIDSEHSRITGELEQMEKELDAFKKSRTDLQQRFREKTAGLQVPGDAAGRHSELFSDYFTEEEKISRMIAYLEQTLERYRHECSILKEEKAQLEKQYEEKLERMNREVEELRSKSILEQQRFKTELRYITYHREKAEQGITDLEAEISQLKNDNENLKELFNRTIEKTGRIPDELHQLQKKYEKAASEYSTRYSEQEAVIRNLKSELNIIQRRFHDFVGIIRTSIGPDARDLSLEEITNELPNLLKSASKLREQSSLIKLLQEQQKNDKRSLALNADLITELSDRVKNMEIQLRYIRDTNVSAREKILEEENKRLSDTVKELKTKKPGRPIK